MKQNPPPLHSTDDCAYCEQTKREVEQVIEQLESKFRKAVSVLRKRQGVLESAIIVLMKPNLVNELLDKLKQEKEK